MKNVLLFCFTLILFCFQSVKAQDTIDEQSVDSYVVICGQSRNYETLHQQMSDLHKKSGIKIDMQDKIYNKKKKEITLPENYSDDIYAGEYYPRRETGTYLSLEKLDYYTQKDKDKKEMVLVTGIFRNKKGAYQLVNRLKKYAPKIFVLKARIYMGCMH